MSEVQLERTATASLLQAKAEVASKRATNERAHADLELYKPLLETSDVSKFQYDAVDATARVAQSDLLAAEQQLAAAEQNVEIARATVNSSKARVARSQSLLLETQAREQQVPITELLKIGSDGQTKCLYPLSSSLPVAGAETPATGLFDIRQ